MQHLHYEKSVSTCSYLITHPISVGSGRHPNFYKLFLCDHKHNLLYFFCSAAKLCSSSFLASVVLRREALYSSIMAACSFSASLNSCSYPSDPASSSSSSLSNSVFRAPGITGKNYFRKKMHLLVHFVSEYILHHGLAQGRTLFIKKSIRSSYCKVSSGKARVWPWRVAATPINPYDLNVPVCEDASEYFNTGVYTSSDWRHYSRVREINLTFLHTYSALLLHTKLTLRGVRHKSTFD